MKLKVAFINEKISELINYRGRQLSVHTVIIYDSELDTDEHYGTVVYQFESTFLPEWKQRDIEERTKEAERIIESLERDPSQIGSGRIRIKISPNEGEMFPCDNYEDDCRLLKSDGHISLVRIID